jgi:acetylornithine deacetylase/succinyl-diaminopimelate desuccinylase-like protein
LPSEPLNTKEAKTLLHIADDAVKNVVGYDLSPYPFTGWNDITFIRNTGIPTLGLGPADIPHYNGHGPDEWVSLKKIIEFTKIYGLMALEACGFKQ